MFAFVRCSIILPLLIFLPHRRHTTTLGSSWVWKQYQMKTILALLLHWGIRGKNWLLLGAVSDAEMDGEVILLREGDQVGLM